jgi:hypothetical protein
MTPPSLILLEGRIYADAAAAPVEALAVAEDRVVAVGANEEVLAGSIRSTEIVRLGGRTVIPGLIDAHLHLEQYALNLEKIECETDTRQDCLTRVRERAASARPGEWILGHGWNQNNWDRYGTAEELDRVAPRNPVYLTAKSLHAAWVNTLAMRIAGIDDQTPDPEGGVIGRAAGGAPSGILFERAMEAVSSKVSHPTPAHLEQAILEAQDRLLRAGLTAVNDFDGPRCFRALQAVKAQGKLGLRIIKHLRAEDVEAALSLGIHTGFGDEWIRIGCLKVFADGALGPRTAAMLEPYQDEPENMGILAKSAEQIAEIGMRASEGRIALAVHAIGDRANREAIEGLARIRASGSRGAPLRHRIEHVQLLHPEDVPKLAANDIIASMQPIHATSDMMMADRHWGRRCRLAYAWKSLLDAGTTLAFGSDAPVEAPDPFLGLHAALTRQRVDGSPGPEGWIPQERLSLREALTAYLHGPAYAAGMEREMGRLAIGSFADLVVLDQDIFEASADTLSGIRPLATMVAGAWKWRAF